MKKNKLVSLFLLLAMSATAVGASALTACGANGGGGSNDTVYKKVTGKTYYVSPDGSPDAAGTANDPMDVVSLLHNYDVASTSFYDSILQPGDTVIVKPGVYVLDQRIRCNFSGNYANYITIKAEDPTAETVLSFYDLIFDGNNRGVEIDGNYVHWDGIDVRGAGDNGMYIGGSYNIVENAEFYDNRDTGLQIGRADGTYSDVNMWPSYNLIKNCTSYNNYDNETLGENADGFAAKLTVGFHNIFDGCIAFRNSDDGWDLYAKADSGNVGSVLLYNCVAFENGFIMETQATFNAKCNFDEKFAESNTNSYKTSAGDGNGFKLGGQSMEADVFAYNCLSFNNRMHGVTDNSNPGVMSVEKITSFNNAAGIDNDPSSTTFGHIKGADADSCNNIDLARYVYSYNHLKDILSVGDGTAYNGADEYRGTVENAYFYNTPSRWYRVDELTECDTATEFKDTAVRDAKRGTEMNALALDEIFNALPDKDLGLRGAEIDVQFRNEDGSINFSSVLKNINSNITAGCDLSKTSWDEYEHAPYTDLTTAKGANNALASAAVDLLYLPVNPDGVYQDFWVVTRVMNRLEDNVVWTSSNPSVLEVTDEFKNTVNGFRAKKIIVNRSPEEDINVTLTAKVTFGSITKSKSFELVIKKNEFQIGGVEIDGVVNNEVIVDKGSGYNLQPFNVVNATSDSGRYIDPSLYEYGISIKKGPDKASCTTPVVPYTSFNSNEEGVYEVTINITLKDQATLAGGASKTGSYTYYIYVVARDANNVEFVDDTAAINVYKDGFIISGTPTVPTGNLYVIKQSTTAAAPTAQQIVANGEVNSFRSTSISFKYSDSNTEGYKVYYVFTNLEGTITSSVGSFEVGTQDITSKAEFEAMLASNNSYTIYRLMNDIDCGGTLSVGNSDTVFTGLFNGMGHTISNISLSTASTSVYACIFQSVTGGTIMNVKFNELHFRNTAATSTNAAYVGIVGMMRGGYIYNVSVTNVESYSTGCGIAAVVARVNAESGKVQEVYISKVSVINPVAPDTNGEYDTYEAYDAYANNQYKIWGGDSSCRMGGIVGWMQEANGSFGYGIAKIYISDCYVQSVIEGDQYIGGIYGRSDDRTAGDYLEITNCYFNGVVSGRSYVGGMIGGFTGTGVLRFTNCINLGVLYYGSGRDIIGRGTVYPGVQKNCSAIIGHFADNADIVVTGCYGIYGNDYNEDYGVVIATEGNYRRKDFWSGSLKFDMTDTWVYVDSVDIPGYLDMPCVQLKNVGDIN